MQISAAGTLIQRGRDARIEVEKEGEGLRGEEWKEGWVEVGGWVRGRERGKGGWDNDMDADTKGGGGDRSRLD